MLDPEMEDRDDEEPDQDAKHNQTITLSKFDQSRLVDKLKNIISDFSDVWNDKLQVKALEIEKLQKDRQSMTKVVSLSILNTQKQNHDLTEQRNENARLRAAHVKMVQQMEVMKKDNLGLRDVDKFKQANKDLEKEIVKLQAQLQYERQGGGAQNAEDLAKQKETLTQNHDQMLSDLFMLKKKQSEMQAEKTQQDQRLNDLYIQISKTDEIYNDKLQLLETLKKQIENINESSEALKG